MSGLTPIRVRGRRKRPTHDNDERAEPPAKRGKPLMPLEASQRSLQARRKRPFISGSSSWLESHPAPLLQPQSLQPESQFGLPKRKKRKKRKNLSRLERLPVELIEKIFLYSLNVNFARSSPSLAAAVSSERIYRVFVLLAFWRDPSPHVSGIENANRESVSSAGVSRILRPFDYVPIDEDERRILQSTVLRCKWCTVHRVLNQLPDLMNLTIQRLWIDAGIHMELDQQDNLFRFLESPNHKEVFTFEGTKESIHYTLTIHPFISISIRTTSPESTTESTHHILNLLDFPAHLLQGTPSPGFNKETIAFLELLRATSGFTHTDPPTMHLAKNVSLSRDALQEGIHTAIIHRSHDALLTLLKIDEYFVRSTTSPTTTDHNVNVNGEDTVYELPPEHYRAALPDTQTFQILLRASAESVPPDDPAITAWAMELDDPFGNWLLDLMLRMPEVREGARRGPERGVFWMGRCNGDSEMGGRYLREVLGVDGLEGWMGEVLDFVSMVAPGRR